MAGTLKRIAGPTYLGASVVDLYTPPASTIYTIVKHIHVANATAGTVTFTIFVGGTGGSTPGTELFKQFPVASNSSFDYYCNMRMASTDFLSGNASAGSSLVITIEGEQVVV